MKKEHIQERKHKALLIAVCFEQHQTTKIHRNSDTRTEITAARNILRGSLRKVQNELDYSS